MKASKFFPLGRAQADGAQASNFAYWNHGVYIAVSAVYTDRKGPERLPSRSTTVLTPIVLRRREKKKKKRKFVYFVADPVAGKKQDQWFQLHPSQTGRRCLLETGPGRR